MSSFILQLFTKNKRREEHLFKQPSKAVFQLFSPFFCSSLGLRSKPPTAAAAPTAAALYSPPRFIICNSWQMDKRPGSPPGEAKAQKEKDLKRGGDRGRLEVRTGRASSGAGDNFKVAIWFGKTVPSSVRIQLHETEDVFSQPPGLFNRSRSTPSHVCMLNPSEVHAGEAWKQQWGLQTKPK